MRITQYLALLFIFCSLFSCKKDSPAQDQNTLFKELLAKDLNGSVWDFYAARSWSREDGITELELKDSFIQSIEFVDKWFKVTHKKATEQYDYSVSTSSDVYVLTITSPYEELTVQVNQDYTQIYVSIKPSKESDAIQTIHFKKKA